MFFIWPIGYKITVLRNYDKDIKRIDIYKFINIFKIIKDDWSEYYCIRFNIEKKYMYLFIYISIFIRYEIMKKIIRDNFLWLIGYKKIFIK